MDNNQSLDVVKDIVKEAYCDGGKPIVESTGELIGLVPRAIKAALSPLEKWILQREYNVAETKKLLEEKLKNTPPELIQSPEAHIAVPALQYISYCMDNDELRNLYANLLARAMNKEEKAGVHPSFVEIIKQLCPDEAKILKYIVCNPLKSCVIPTVSIRFEDEKHQGLTVVSNFSDIGDLSGCENPTAISTYFNNMKRLGLLEESPVFSQLTDKTRYEPIKKHKFIVENSHNIIFESIGCQVKLIEGYMKLSNFGEAFCAVCVATD